MFSWLHHRIVAPMERRYACDATWMHHMIDSNPLVTA